VVKDGATTGKTCLFVEGPQCFVNKHIFVVRITEHINPIFVYFWLWSLSGQAEIAKDFRGSAQGGIGRTFVDTCLIPIAPLEEQHRIVARINELFAEIAEGEAALERARSGLETWRRALLKAAITGELTREFRESSKLSETGTKLLARTRAERKGHASKSVRSSKVPFEPLDISLLPELPPHWAWCTVAEAGDVSLGRQRAPQHHDGPNMRPYLRVANVLDDKLDLSDVKQMNFTPTEFLPI